MDTQVGLVLTENNIKRRAKEPDRCGFELCIFWTEDPLLPPLAPLAPKYMVIGFEPTPVGHRIFHATLYSTGYWTLDTAFYLGFRIEPFKAPSKIHVQCLAEQLLQDTDFTESKRKQDKLLSPSLGHLATSEACRPDEKQYRCYCITHRLVCKRPTPRACWTNTPRMFLHTPTQLCVLDAPLCYRLPEKLKEAFVPVVHS